MYVPDYLDLYKRYEEDQERRLKHRPVCCICDEHVQDDFYYEINGEVVCRNCLEDHCKKYVEDYIE